MGKPICHVEINVSNLEKSKKFYADLFGWDFQGWGDAPYALFQTGKEPGGGLSAFGGPTGPGGTIAYIQVEEIEPYLEKAKQLGGGVAMEKHLIDEKIGWSATITDLDGNLVGLFKPAQ